MMRWQSLMHTSPSGSPSTLFLTHEGERKVEVLLSLQIFMRFKVGGSPEEP